MFNIFKKKENNNIRPEIGSVHELVHDATVYQYGSITFNGKPFSVKLADGSELSVNNKVRILEDRGSHFVVERV